MTDFRPIAIFELPNDKTVTDFATPSTQEKHRAVV